MKLFLILLLFFFCSNVWADSEGPNSPGTMADDDAVGTRIWLAPNSAKASDNITTAPSVAAGVWTSHYLKATNFGFSIPTGATIDGILVEIEGRDDGNNRNYDTVKIVKSDGDIGATNKGGAATPDADDYVSFGSSVDLWGETWASSDINNSNFGVVISFDGENFDSILVDHIRITVYYTEATTIQGATLQGATIN